MDVILCAEHLYVGGSERVILKIADHFSAPIYVADVSGLPAQKNLSDFDIRKIKPSASAIAAISAIPLGPDAEIKRLALSSLTFLTAKIREDYDVLNTHLPPAHWLINNNGRMCWYCHGYSASFTGYPPAEKWISHTKKQMNFLESRIFSFALHIYRKIDAHSVSKIEKIVTCSNHTRNLIEKYFHRQDAEVIYPGVDPEDFYCDGYQKYFFVCGRFVPNKRFELAIDAFKRFNKGKNWKLVIAGFVGKNYQSIAYLDFLLKQAKNANVVFEIDPNDTKIKKLYSQCSAFIFPSFYEDWGIVALEAMASCKPVISVNEGGPRESIVHGKTGFLVNSAEEMAEKMEFLASNPDICEKMGKAARDHVEKNFTWRVFLNKIGKAFKETANRKCED